MHTSNSLGSLVRCMWGSNPLVRQLVISKFVPVVQLMSCTTEYTVQQPRLSGVHSVMRVKLALAGEGGGCTPTPSHYIYHHQ
jgi:hypothetical protein